jgi:hypothetical protein
VRLYIANATGIEDGQSPVVQGSSFGVVGSPTTGSFALILTLEAQAPVTVRAYSQDGRLVSENQFGSLPSGDHELPFDLTGNPPGVYLMVCTTGQSVMHSRVVLTE